MRELVTEDLGRPLSQESMFCLRKKKTVQEVAAYRRVLQKVPRKDKRDVVHSLLKPEIRTSKKYMQGGRLKTEDRDRKNGERKLGHPTASCTDAPKYYPGEGG